MQTTTEEKPVTEGRYRFTVATADEAVRVLRERLGENARVVSVRQIEGAGLARFLRAPKLEVIAEVVAAPPPEPFTSESVVLESESAAQETKAVLEDALAMCDEEVAIAPGQNGTGDIPRILSRVGFPDVLLATLKASPRWLQIEALPFGMALNEVAVLLRDQYKRKTPRPLGGRVAFIGAAGAGKTTALCKWLAADVFVRQRRAAVLKVDMDRANPGDGLAVFCEALGVPLSRTADDLPELAAGESVYIDLPGITLGDKREIEECARVLADLSVSSRVLVINAAYEANLIRRLYETGEALGATHVVFTHLDELAHWGKLWEFVLGHALTPLFLSSGQSIAGDFIEEVFPSILARTFPAAGSEIAKRGTGL